MTLRKENGSFGFVVRGGSHDIAAKFRPFTIVYVDKVNSMVKYVPLLVVFGNIDAVVVIVVALVVFVSPLLLKLLLVFLSALLYCCLADGYCYICCFGYGCSCCC